VGHTNIERQGLSETWEDAALLAVHRIRSSRVNRREGARGPWLPDNVWRTDRMTQSIGEAR